VKKIFIFFIVAISLFASIKANQKSQILSINKNRAIIEDIDAPIGSSGIVIHHFDKNHATIVAAAKLISKNEIEFKIFSALKQEALPTPNIKPKVGDEVILNYLYDRGLIISPNFSTYKEIKNLHKDIEWIHPDLFAAELSKNKNPTPTKKDFKKFCEDYSVGILYFAIKNRGYFVDCYSFNKLSSEKIINNDKDIQTPFYSRVKEIETNWFNFYGNDKITNYNKYYKNLLENK